MPTTTEKVKSFPKTGVMTEDMIGQLDENLILEILSLVPIKTAVSTSVLSKEWQSRWKSVPKLNFYSEDYQSELQTFSQTVHKSLLSYEPKVLESFHLSFGSDKADAVDVVHWIKTAFALNLRTLVLEFLLEPFEVDYFVFTSSLCTCDTLVTLKLGSLILVDIPAPGSMKSLKTLHLILAFYTNDESICNLLSGCPRLEELVVERTYESTVKFFTIKVPSLQRLRIYDDNFHGEFAGYVIDVPSLKYLEIGELACPHFSLNAPELVEANIAGVHNVIGESLVSVRDLVLNVSPSQTIYPTTGCIFYQLVYLQMYTQEPGWYDLLTWMLEHSPKLQVLKLDGKYRIYSDDYHVLGWEWNKPKCVPECLLSHLKTFVWKRYDWKREKEEEVAIYILKNAAGLKNATFSTNPIEPGQLDKLKQRRRTHKKMNNLLKASNACHLVFKFE
ncbi:hypothetical protein Bca4012_040457 [Brassica carinata]